MVVDGILGIGGRPGLDDAAAALLDLAAPDACVVAVDLPSGVDPDTGAVGAGAVRADVTVTFGVLKPALLLPPAVQHAGRVELVDIGLDPADLTPTEVASLDVADLAAAWPWPHPGDDKYRRGVLGVVAGGSGYTGAAVLCTGAAVRSGAGMVRYVGPDEPDRAGPGPLARGGARRRAGCRPGCSVRAWTPTPATVRPTGCATPWPRTCRAWSTPARSTCCRARRDAPTLLTPHAGELARLLTRLGAARPSGPTSRAGPLEHARAAARLTGATVLLKGATTARRPAGRRPRCSPSATGRPGWPPRAPATCWPAWPGPCSRPAWTRWRRVRWRRPCTAGRAPWPAPAARWTPVGCSTRCRPPWRP